MVARRLQPDGVLSDLFRRKDGIMRHHLTSAQDGPCTRSREGVSVLIGQLCAEGKRITQLHRAYIGRNLRLRQHGYGIDAYRKGSVDNTGAGRQRHAGIVGIGRGEDTGARDIAGRGGPGKVGVHGRTVLVVSHCLHLRLRSAGHRSGRRLDFDAGQYRGIRIYRQLVGRSLELHLLRTVFKELDGLFRRRRVVHHIVIFAGSGMIISGAQRMVGINIPLNFAVGTVHVRNIIGDTARIGILGQREIAIPHLVENGSSTVRIKDLHIAQADIADAGLTTETALLRPIAHLLAGHHGVEVPAGEIQILIEILQNRRNGQPLDGVHPDRIAGEPGPPTHALCGQVGTPRRLILGIVNVLTVTVEPIFGRSARLHDITEDTGIAHGVIAQSGTQ